MLCGSAESDVALLPSNSGHRKTCHKKQLNRFSLVQIDSSGMGPLPSFLITKPLAVCPLLITKRLQAAWANRTEEGRRWGQGQVAKAGSDRQGAAAAAGS